MDFQKIFNYLIDKPAEFFFFLLITYSIYSLFTLKDIHLTGYRYVKLHDLHLKAISNCIDNMNPFDFEDFVGYLFGRTGNMVENTSRTRDGGYDLMLNNDTLVEIKHYSDGNSVSRPVVQKLVGACIENDIEHGIIVTTSSFTKEAYESIKKCKKVNIDILYKDDLLDMCKQIDSTEVLEWLGYDKELVCEKYQW